MRDQPDDHLSHAARALAASGIAAALPDDLAGQPAERARVVREAHAMLARLFDGLDGSPEAAAPAPDGIVLVISPAESRPPRVLVVEDEWFIAADIADILSEMGMEVLGPVPSVSEALGLIRAAAADGGITAAVLDINLQGEAVTPVADALTAISVPFIYATGYDAPERSGGDGAPFLQKPFTSDTLVHAVQDLAVNRCGTAGDSPGARGTWTGGGRGAGDTYRPSARIERSITAASS